MRNVIVSMVILTMLLLVTSSSGLITGSRVLITGNITDLTNVAMKNESNTFTETNTFNNIIANDNLTLKEHTITQTGGAGGESYHYFTGTGLGDAWMRLKYAYDTSDLTFQRSADGSTFTGEIMTIDWANSRVGINQHTPTARFEVGGTVKIGANGDGKDLTVYGATAGQEMFWDASEDRLDIDGYLTIDETMAIGSTPDDSQKARILGTWTDTGAKSTLRLQSVYSPSDNTTQNIIAGADCFAQLGNNKWGPGSYMVASRPLMVGTANTGNTNLNMFGVYPGYLQYGGTSHFKEIFAGRFLAANIAFSGTVVADGLYGLYIANPNPGTGSFTVPKTYGLYIVKHTQGSSENHGIYLEGSDNLLTFNNVSTIYHDGTNLIIDPNASNSNGILYVTTNASFENVIDRSWYWDKSLGSSLDYVKDTDDLKNPLTQLHSDDMLNDFEKTTYKVTDYSKPVKVNKIEETCFPDMNGTREICQNSTVTKTVYPYKKMETGRLVSATVGKHEQNIYDLIQEINALKAEIELLKKG